MIIFKEKIRIVNKNIKAIINIMNGVKKNIEQYNDIFCNILNNYEIENRNYNILKSLNGIMSNDIYHDITNISDNHKESIYSQFKILVKMFKKMNNNNISDELIKYQLEDFKEVEYSNLQNTQLLYKYGENSLCKILSNNDKFLGTGFFIEINAYRVPFKKALLTCNHIFPEEYFKKNEYLYFSHKGTNKKIDIKECQIFSKNNNYLELRQSFGKRKIFLSKEFDYALIDILDNDYILDKGLEIFQLDYYSSFRSSDIVILHYPNLKDISFSLGTFIKKDDHFLIHNCYIDSLNAGAPIINKNNNKRIIGMHFGKNRNCGLGVFKDAIYYDIFKNIDRENSLENNFKTLNIHKSFITNIILFDDNTLCSCSTDGNVFLFDVNNFECIGKINEKTEIIYHAKLSNNDIILCCKDNSLKIYKEKIISTMEIIKSYFWGGSVNSNEQGESGLKEYELSQTLNGHENTVCQVIEINKDLIISCGLDKNMKIWKRNQSDYYNYNYVCIHTLKVNEEDGSSTNILKINESKIVSAATNANYI